MAKRGRKKKKDAMDAQGLQTQDHPDLVERMIWPKDKPLPEFYVKRKAFPCKFCRRILTDSMGQAVVTQKILTGGEVARVRCKVCEKSWPMPIQEV